MILITLTRILGHLVFRKNPARRWWQMVMALVRLPILQSRLILLAQLATAPIQQAEPGELVSQDKQALVARIKRRDARVQPSQELFPFPVFLSQRLEPSDLASNDCDQVLPRRVPVHRRAKFDVAPVLVFNHGQVIR